MRQMAYRKIIRINPYSRSSIIDAIKELEAEKDEIEKKRKKFVKAVAKAMAKRIEERYGSVRSSNITYDEENGSTGIFVWAMQHTEKEKSKHMDKACSLSSLVQEL